MNPDFDLLKERWLNSFSNIKLNLWEVFVSSILLVKRGINLELSSITCLEWSSIIEEEEKMLIQEIQELQSLTTSLIDEIVQVYMN